MGRWLNELVSCQGTVRGVSGAVVVEAGPESLIARNFLDGIETAAFASGVAVSFSFFPGDALWWREDERQGFGYGSPGGYTRRTSRWWLARVHPDDRDAAGKVFLRTRKMEFAASFRLRLQMPDGKYRVIRAHPVLIPAEKLSVPVLFTVYRDITARLQHVRELEAAVAGNSGVSERDLRRESERRLVAERVVRRQSQALTETLGILLRKPSLPAYIRALLRILTREHGGLWAGFWKIEKPEEPARLMIRSYIDEATERSYESFSLKYRVSLERLWRLYRDLLEEHRCTTILRADDPRIPRPIRQGFRQFGTGSILLSPFLLGDRLLGWITFLNREPANQIDVDKVAFIEASARQATLALYLTEMNEALREAEVGRERERLLEEQANEAIFVNRILHRAAEGLEISGGLEDFIFGILDHLAELFGGKLASLWLHDEETGISFPAYGKGTGRCFRLSTETRERVGRSCVEANRKLLSRWLKVDGPIVEKASSPPVRRLLEEWGRSGGVPAVAYLVVVPLRFRDETLGFLLTASETPPETSSGRLLATEALALQLGLAMRFEALSAARQSAALSDERNRIARDMHDLLAQGFSGIALQIEAMRAECSDIPRPVALRMEKIRNQAERSVEQLRRTLKMLRPASLQEHSLVEALTALAAETSAIHQIPTRFSPRAPEVKLDPVVENHLFAIASEAVQNSVQHSGAKQIVISLRSLKRGTVLTIRDDGKGFAPDSADGRTHFGLLNMRERSQACRADLRIRSRKTGGTEVEVVLRG